MNRSAELPGVLGQIAEIAGDEAAIRLANRFGGDRFYVPQVATPECELTKVVGLEAAKLIVASLGYGEVRCPLGPRTWENRLHNAIAMMLDRGCSNREIAIGLGVSDRTVSKYRALIEGRGPHAGRAAGAAGAGG